MIENFEKLELNRKIDVLVAEYIFGIKDIIIEEKEWYYMGEGGLHFRFCYDKNNCNNVPCYSTLLTSAWDIVRKFDYIYIYRSKNFNDGLWECKLCKEDPVDRKYYAWAETEQLAICYAGLKAVNYPIGDFLKGEII